MRDSERTKSTTRDVNAKTGVLALCDVEAAFRAGVSRPPTVDCASPAVKTFDFPTAEARSV